MRLIPLCASLLLPACGGVTQLSSNTVLEIEAPGDGDSVFSQTMLEFRAVATNPAGLSSVQLFGGTVLLATCEANKAAEMFTTITCQFPIAIPSISAQVQSGKLKLTASSVDTKNLKRSRSITVTVVPILVSYAAPMASGTPPIANVSGTSALTLDVQSELPIVSVDVTYMGLPLTQFSGAPYTQMIDWPVELMVGQTQIQAVATDTTARTGSATLTVNVQCAQNADCPVNQMCCVTSGACIAMGATCQ